MNWSNHRGGGRDNVRSRNVGRHSTSAHDRRDDGRDAWAQYERHAPPNGANNVPRPIHGDGPRPSPTPRVNAGARYDDSGFHRDDGNHHHRGPPPMPNGSAFSSGNAAGKHAHDGDRNANSNTENNCSSFSGNKRYKNDHRRSPNSGAFSESNAGGQFANRRGQGEDHVGNSYHARSSIGNSGGGHCESEKQRHSPAPSNCSKPHPQRHSHNSQSSSFSNSSRGNTQLQVLYTHQKTKKKKTWQDGRLVISGTRGSLYEACPSQGHSAGALDALDFLGREARALAEGRFSSEDFLESDKFLIQVEGPWTAKGLHDGGGGDADHLWNKRLPQFGTQTTRPKTSGMKNVLSKKFRVPRKQSPMHPAERRQRAQAKMNKCRRPLQPGELERQYYGDGSFHQGEGRSNGQDHGRQTGGHGGGGDCDRGGQGHGMQNGVEFRRGGGHYHRNSAGPGAENGGGYNERNGSGRGWKGGGRVNEGGGGDCSHHNGGDDNTWERNDPRYPVETCTPHSGNGGGSHSGFRNGVAGARLDASRGTQYEYNDPGNAGGNVRRGNGGYGAAPFRSSTEFHGENSSALYGEEESDGEGGENYDGAATGDAGGPCHVDGGHVHEAPAPANERSSYPHDNHEGRHADHARAAHSQQRQGAAARSNDFNRNGSGESGPTAYGMSTTSLDAVRPSGTNGHDDHLPRVNTMDQQPQPQLATADGGNPDKLPLLSVPSQDDDGEDELLALLDDSSARKPPATAHEFPPVLSNQGESQNEASSSGHSGNSNLQACCSSHDHGSIHEKTDNNSGQNEEEDSNSFLGAILQAEEQANNRSLTGGSGVLSSFDDDLGTGWGENGFGEEDDNKGEEETEESDDLFETVQDDDLLETVQDNTERTEGGEHPQKEVTVKLAEEVAQTTASFDLPSCGSSSSEEED